MWTAHALALPGSPALGAAVEVACLVSESPTGVSQDAIGYFGEGEREPQPRRPRWGEPHPLSQKEP